MYYIKTSQVRRALATLTLALILISFIPARRAQAAAGDLDPTFGAGGKVVTDFFNDDDDAEAIAIQADGKIIVVGDAFQSPDGFGFIVVRYNTNGTLDASFGNGGKAFLNIFGGLATAVAIQQDGKIVAVGRVTNPSDSNEDFVVVRFNANGSLDSSFGSNGKVVTDFGGLESANAVKIAPDGKIVVAGGIGFSSLSFALARYNSDGSLDASFGVGGKITASFQGVNVGVAGLGIQSDGKIIVGGSSSMFDPQAFYLVRYNANASLDVSFGVAGIVKTPLSGIEATARALAMQPDGKIILAGQSTPPAMPNFSSDFLLARYNSNGTLDASFGNGGLVTTDFSNGEFVSALALQTNGKIIAAGVTSSFTSSDFALARYLANGALDPSFGIGGRVTTDFGNGRDIAVAVAVQSDGQIIAAGNSNGLTRDFALARYAGDKTDFGVCLQDDSSSNLLQISSGTGDYQFTNCGGVVIGGVGTVTRRGNVITLQANAGDRRVLANIDLGTHRATATVQSLATGRTFTIADRNTADDTCSCQSPGH